MLDKHVPLAHDILRARQAVRKQRRGGWEEVASKQSAAAFEQF